MEDVEENIPRKRGNEPEKHEHESEIVQANENTPLGPFLRRERPLRPFLVDENTEEH